MRLTDQAHAGLTGGLRDVVNRFKGPFEPEMSRTEAQLILNVKCVD